MPQNILITGASSGIGKALTINLANHGYVIYAIARNESRLAILKNNFPEKIHTVAADIATEDGRKKIIKCLPTNLKISHLINNAAVLSPSGPLKKIDLAAWRYQIGVNLEAPLFLTRDLLPMLQGGRILNLTIYSSFKVLEGLGAYGISKAALNMLSEYMKAEFKKYHIGVALALPGLVDTQIKKQLSKKECAAIIKHNDELKKQGKLLSAETAAQFLKWILCDTDDKVFSNGIWDIYDKSHHTHWAKGIQIPMR